jgi:hypothetical protein
VGSRWRQLRRADHHFAQAEVMINAVISNRSALTASASSGPPDPARRVSAPRAHRRHGRQPHQRPGHQDLVTSRLSRVGLGAERARVRPGSHQCVGSAGYLLVVLAYRFRLARLARPERSLKSGDPQDALLRAAYAHVRDQRWTASWTTRVTALADPPQPGTSAITSRSASTHAGPWSKASRASGAQQRPGWARASSSASALNRCAFTAGAAVFTRRRRDEIFPGLSGPQRDPPRSPALSGWCSVRPG